MQTCGMMGEVVGMAASICAKYDANPRGVYTEHLEELRDRTKTLGATITRDIFSFPGGRRFHFTEPGGSEFAIWSDK